MPTKIQVVMPPEEQPETPPDEQPSEEQFVTAQSIVDEARAAPPLPPLPPEAPGVTTDEFHNLTQTVDRLAAMMTGVLQQLQSPRPTEQPDHIHVEAPRPSPPPLERPPPRVSPPVSMTVKNAATELVNQLEADDGRAFRNFCEKENVTEVEAIRATLTCAIQQQALHATVRSFVRFSSQAAVHRESCPVCRFAFHPNRAGEVYCCNACSAKAAGLRPVVEHAPQCPTGRGQEIPVVWGQNALMGEEPAVQDQQQASPFYRQR